MSMRPSTKAGAALLLATLPLSCKLDPKAPELEYELNVSAVEANAALAEDPNAQANLEGALEMLFGTPSAPGYMRLEDWIDDEYDPNEGSLELTDEEYEAVTDGNRKEFSQQLTAIQDGRFEDVREPIAAPGLWESWQAMLEDPDRPENPDEVLFTDDDGVDITWRDEAAYLFESYYPTLSDSAELYRQQCFHCHGASGGGDGSTSEFLNPRPRDYRRGIFKFTALNNKARPRHGDIYRILHEGIYTTAMPSFARLSEARLHGLVDYVELLSKRGETELLLIDEYDADEGLAYEKVKETYEFVFDRWEQGTDEVIVFEDDVPPSTPERIAHGRELFMDVKQANCVQCHGQNGRGTYDNPRPPSAWETDAETGEKVRVKDDWGNAIEVRNLSRGVFRFGRRPVDLYRRVYAGINGTPMPAHYGMQITEPDGTQRPLDENDIWDIVHYVRSISTHAPVAHAGDHGDDHSEEAGH